MNEPRNEGCSVTVALPERQSADSAAYEGLMRAKEAFRAEAHRLARELADAKEALEAMQGGWQPIETAPKDGTRVLMYREIKGVDTINEAWWRESIFGDMEWGGRGWSYPEFSQPTHWMPLPLPPSRSGRVGL